MFWYAIQLVPGSNDADDWRFTDDRGLAIVAMLICGMRVRVCAKPLRRPPRHPARPPATAERSDEMIVHDDPKVAAVGQEIAAHLAEIASLFKPGVKITLIARHPSRPDGACDVVITDDTIGNAIAALTQRLAQEQSR